MDVNIGKGITLAVDTTKLPGNALDHIIYIGLRNVLMDSHASVTKESSNDVVAESKAVAEKKLAALYSGEVRIVGEREGDPVKAEAVRLALSAIKTAIRKAGKKVADYDAKALRKTAQDNAAGYMELAAKRVAEAKAANIEIDVSGLVG